MRNLGSQAHGTTAELELMATLKACDCGSDVLCMLEPCEVRRNAYDEYWDGVNWQDAIRTWNEKTRNKNLASGVIGGFV